MRRLLAIMSLSLIAVPTAVFASPELDLLVERSIREKKAGRLEESLAALREAYAIEPLPVLLNNIGAVLEELGRYREAKEAADQVAADPKAGADLRARAAERSASLAVKVDRGWLRLEIDPPSAQVLVDGALPSGGDGSVDALEYGGAREISAFPGRRTIEMRRPGAKDVVLRRLDLVAGERLVFREDLMIPGENDARLALDGAPDPIATITIDGYRLRGQRVSAVRLEAGDHNIEITFEGAPPLRQRRTLTRKQSLDLFTRDVVVVAPVVAAPAASGRSIWPFVAGGGAGAALAGGGVLLLVSSSSDRDQVRSALAAPEPISSLTQREAQSLQDGADTKATLGTIGLVFGSAVVTAAIVWWFSG